MVFKIVRQLPVISQSYGLTLAAMRSCETSYPVDALKCSALRLLRATSSHYATEMRHFRISTMLYG